MTPDEPCASKPLRPGHFLIGALRRRSTVIVHAWWNGCRRIARYPLQSRRRIRRRGVELKLRCATDAVSRFIRTSTPEEYRTRLRATKGFGLPGGSSPGTAPTPSSSRRRRRHRMTDRLPRRRLMDVIFGGMANTDDF